MMNKQGRPSQPQSDNASKSFETFSGHRGLQQEEGIIFDRARSGETGVDLPIPGSRPSRLGGLERTEEIGLAGLSEPEAVRHYVRLSQKNYSIDTGFYPLGSCTMKHNPRLNEKVARLPGFADIHPLQPVQTVQGALEVIDTLAHWLKELTGMPAVAMSPKAGAHGELCGLMAIRAALEAQGDARKVVLVPESAHGTNPATAAQCGYAIKTIPAADDGLIHLDELKAQLNDEVAAVMLTNPNTCGLFERDIVAVADAVHAAGAYLYCDGANFNAIMGKVRPGDLGIDAMHINLHKTFSTPHGGGGPGAGPVVLSAALAPYAPVPYIVNEGDGYHVIETEEQSDVSPLGRMTAFYGQMGMFTRALTYAMSHGADGLRQVAEDAVLNANYVLAKLKDLFSAPFGDRCMHECLFDDAFLKDTGITTLDFAKAMIDEGYHPMTVYFPLVVHGAMLIEPTETESKETLDRFCQVMRSLALEAKDGQSDRFTQAPQYTPRRRLDETQAARNPVLRWLPPKSDDISPLQAAE